MIIECNLSYLKATDDLLPSKSIASIMEERCLGKIQETEVVVEGQTSQRQEVISAICPGQCSGHGTCNQGTCNCEQGNMFCHFTIIVMQDDMGEIKPKQSQQTKTGCGQFHRGLAGNIAPNGVQEHEDVIDHIHN